MTEEEIIKNQEEQIKLYKAMLEISQKTALLLAEMLEQK